MIFPTFFQCFLEVYINATKGDTAIWPRWDLPLPSPSLPRTDALELQVLEKAVQHKVMPEACPVITSCSKVGPVISGGPHPSDQNVGIESWTVGMGF